MKTLLVIDGLDPLTPISTVTRLARAVDLVREVMASSDWMTFGEIQEAVSKQPKGKFFSENCISARIRDQRKSKHGAHIVNKRVRAGTCNLYEYQLILNTPEAA